MAAHLHRSFYHFARYITTEGDVARRKMTALNAILIASIRIGLFVGCRLTVLPLLLGEARHASLDDTDDKAGGGGNGGVRYELAQLPQPATQANSRNASSSPFKIGTSSDAPIWQRAVQSLKDPHHVSSHVFSVCFEEATILFALVLLEATDSVSTEALRRNWTFSLVSVVVLAVALIPLCVCLLVTFRLPAASAVQRILYAIPAFLLWCFLFVKVPLPSALATTSTGWLDAALARTALLGVVLIAMLSGSAAASAAYDTYETFFAKRKPRPVTASDVQNAESSFRRTCSDLSTQRRQLEQMRSTPSSADAQAGFIGRMWGSSQRSKEIKSLQQEIFGLETLASAMRDDLDGLRTRHRDAMWARTIQGKILLGAGHLFSIYCVWRVLLAALSLLILGYKEQAPPDFVSLSLAYLVRLIDVDIDLATWTRIFGLLFVGALILMRMRVVLANLSVVFRAVSAGISTSFLVLFLSEVLTIYLLATLIQLRASLPSTYSGEIPIGDAPTLDKMAFEATQGADGSSGSPSLINAPLLASLPSFNVVFGALFDGVFMVTALLTGAYRWYSTENDAFRNDW
jgi:hypothetical protein